jgi:probable H4MPT-linked C1 transfer pathway protein
MAATVLGLDIGGANLKAATADKQAVSVPFALWKQPENLPAALTDLVGRFSGIEELAVTMTGELCDCFETKRQGVEAIIAAVRRASEGRTIRVWTTDGVFEDSEEAKRDYLKVAASNWHALATLAGQYVPHGRAILIDVGSTTTDIIPIQDGVPVPKGKTDHDRLASKELVYTGVRRTPLCALMGWRGAAELFATTLDAYLILGFIPEDTADCDTADGREATKARARVRLCRMYGGEPDTIPEERIEQLVQWIFQEQIERLKRCANLIRLRMLNLPEPEPDPFARLPDQPMALLGRRNRRLRKQRVTFIVSGSGEFLARKVAESKYSSLNDISLSDRLGPEVSACAPAYAVAVLATEGPRPPGGNWLKGVWPWSGRS